jgi:RNA polymerase sigma-70 factor (ECF subfamily)
LPVNADSLTSNLFLASLCNGDGHGAAAFHKYAANLVRLARRQLDRRVLRKESPEDVVQSAFKSFFRLRDEGQLDLTGKHSLWGLLVVIVRRKCVNRNRDYRRGKRDVRREREDVSGQDTKLSWISLANTPLPEEAVMLAEVIEQLTQGLDDRGRQVVLLTMEGFTQREVAEQLGWSERSVRRIVHQVKKRYVELESE